MSDSSYKKSGIVAENNSVSLLKCNHQDEGGTSLYELYNDANDNG